MCGFKSYVLQPNTGTAARDIAVKGLRFLLPPQVDGCGCGDSQCYQVYAAAQAMDEGRLPVHPAEYVSFPPQGLAARPCPASPPFPCGRRRAPPAFGG